MVHMLTALVQSALGSPSGTASPWSHEKEVSDSYVCRLKEAITMP